MNQRTPAEIVAELRRQYAMRNATWPCLLLSELMPLCDAFDAAQAAIAEQTSVATYARALASAALQAAQEDVSVPSRVIDIQLENHRRGLLDGLWLARALNTAEYHSFSNQLHFTYRRARERETEWMSRLWRENFGKQEAERARRREAMQHNKGAER